MVSSQNKILSKLFPPLVEKDQRGVAPIIYVLISVVLIGILSAYGFGAFDGVLGRGRDDAAAARLEAVKLNVDAIYAETGGGTRTNDLGYLVSESPLADGVAVANVSATLRAECAIARSIAQDSSLTVFLRYNNTPTTTGTFAALAPYVDPYFLDHAAVCVDAAVRTDTAFTTAVLNATNIVDSSADLEALFPSTNFVWISIQPDVSNKTLVTDYDLATVASDFGTNGQNANVGRGDTIVIGTRSASGNSMCVRTIYSSTDTEDIGAYYQVVNGTLIDTTNGVASIALCLPEPTRANFFNLGYTRDGFGPAPVSAVLPIA